MQTACGLASTERPLRSGRPIDRLIGRPPAAVPPTSPCDASDPIAFIVIIIRMLRPRPLIGIAATPFGATQQRQQFNIFGTTGHPVDRVASKQVFTLMSHDVREPLNDDARAP